ncbi:uncharacterized protein LOC141591600 [Silene latifolia]|uniref:uncharacterized protein LOC141591600 n=1 Tax=Silene latifolia TaxID=37657 RepID=UPI003D78A238
MAMNTVVEKKGPNFYRTLDVTPLVQISNISINGNLNDGCRVHGDVTVSDKRGPSFSIYHRTKNDPQLMVSDNLLLLTTEDDLNNAVIIPSQYVSLEVELFVISGHDIIPLRRSITLDRTISENDQDDWSEEYRQESVEGNNNWNAEVNFVIFPYAVTATVRVLHFSKDDDFDCFEEIGLSDDGDFESYDKQDVTDYEKNNCTDINKLYGVVTAVASGAGSGDDVSKTLLFRKQKTLLFRKQIEDCVPVQSGRFINLSRSVVAVPAYSSLQIEAFFSDANTKLTIADGMVEFRPAEWWAYKKDITGCNGRIRVQVVWSNAYDQLYRNNIPRDIWGPIASNSGSDREDLLKRQRVMSDQHQQVVSKHPSSATLTDDCNMPKYCSSKTHFNCILPDLDDAEPLLELYSVVVCSKDGNPFKFYGSIVVTSGFSMERILHIDKSHPVYCPKAGISVILRGPVIDSFCILDRSLGILVDIKDADSDAVISRGVISTWTHNMDLIANRRICSVARGEKGFAAVNYSIFPEGVSAHVDIRLNSKFLPGVIKGKIYARYGNYEDIYEDKLFTNFIFLDDGKGVELDVPNSSVPLLKPYLSLPVYSFLIIEAELSISPVNGNSAEGTKTLKGNVTFFKNEGSSQQIGKCDFYMDVSVKFREW